MKKNRFLALLIAMAMLLAAVPVFASAEEPSGITSTMKNVIWMKTTG